MRLWIVVALAMGLSACQPSDVKVKSVRERLEAGETVTFDKPGTKPSNCPTDGPGWSDISLRDDNERKRVVLATQETLIRGGTMYCAEIGSTVAMTINRVAAGKGLVRVKQISFVKLERLTPRHVKGQYFASSNDFDYYKGSIRLFPDNHGVVTVVDVEYLTGSAADEKAIREKAKQEEASPGYKETKKDGEALGTCLKDEAPITYSALEAPESFHAPLLQGQLRSYFLIGSRSCFRQGTDVNVVVNRNDPPAGIVQVKKVKELKIAHLNESYFDNKPDYEALKEQIAKSLKESKLEEKFKMWITLIEISPNKGGGGSECKPASAIKATNKSREEILAEKKWIVSVEGKTCFKAGDMIQVVFAMDDGDSRMEVAAIVKNQFWSEESKTTMLDVELVQGERK